MLTYAVEIDTDDNGSYETDISADVMGLAWRLGMVKPHQSVAPLSKAEITLDNQDETYSPESGSSNIEIGQKVRIQSTTAAPVTTTMFVGIIAAVNVTRDAKHGGHYIAIIHLEGVERELWITKVLIEPQIAVLPNTVMAVVMAEVGGLTFFGDTGINTFAYMADNWMEGILAIDGIRQAVDGDRGDYYTQRDGNIRFRRRWFNITNDVSQHTFNDDMIDMDYFYGHDIISRVRVTCIPRKQIAAGTVLWTVFNAQRIIAGVSRVIIARFRDDQENPCGAIAIITPVASTDYVANTKKDGTGTDVTANVTVTLTSSDFSAAVLTVTSSYAETIYLQPGMQLRGTPIYGGVPITVEKIDATTEAAYGKNVLELDLPAIDSIDEADAIAQYELTRRKNPVGTMKSIVMSAQDHPVEIATLTMQDRITIIDSNSDHSNDYFIIGEQHEIQSHIHLHRVRWILERVSDLLFWILDTSKMGSIGGDLPDGDMELAGTATWTAGSSATLTKQTGTPHGGLQVLRIARNGVPTPYAQRTMLTIGLLTTIQGWARGDGTAYPQIRSSGPADIVWTGTTSTAWQAFDEDWTPTGQHLQLQSVTNVGVTYTDWDDMYIEPTVAGYIGETTLAY